MIEWICQCRETGDTTTQQYVIVPKDRFFRVTLREGTHSPSALATHIYWLIMTKTPQLTVALRSVAASTAASECSPSRRILESSCPSTNRPTSR